MSALYSKVGDSMWVYHFDERQIHVLIRKNLSDYEYYYEHSQIILTNSMPNIYSVIQIMACRKFSKNEMTMLKEQYDDFYEKFSIEANEEAVLEKFNERLEKLYDTKNRYFNK